MKSLNQTNELKFIIYKNEEINRIYMILYGE